MSMPDIPYCQYCCLCRTTAKEALSGACPEHGGDACLIMVPDYLRAIVEENVRLRAAIEICNKLRDDLVAWIRGEYDA